MESRVFVECNSSIEQESLLATLESFGYCWGGGNPLTGENAYIPTLNGEALDVTDMYYCVDFDGYEKQVTYITKVEARHASFTNIEIFQLGEFFDLLLLKSGGVQINGASESNIYEILSAQEISQEPSEELSTFLDSFSVV